MRASPRDKVARELALLWITAWLRLATKSLGSLRFCGLRLGYVSRQSRSGACAFVDYGLATPREKVARELALLWITVWLRLATKSLGSLRFCGLRLGYVSRKSRSGAGAFVDYGMATSRDKVARELALLWITAWLRLATKSLGSLRFSTFDLRLYDFSTFDFRLLTFDFLREG
jgi:hypothetical protein